jgi:hypothetical protein
VLAARSGSLTIIDLREPPTIGETYLAGFCSRVAIWEFYYGFAFGRQTASCKPDSHGFSSSDQQE